ncbi:MAG: hypothetical protein IJG42_03665 [Muribaculaceae bacterium]|nr:hypothetical protein [Muribaculaceae bacterium]
MIDNEDYNLRLAKYIWAILTSQPIILMSWGIDPKTVKTIELGLEFHVQGFKHRGLVRVTLNEGLDLFEVSLIDENDKIVNTIQSVFCDNLVAVIDGAVEKTDNYEKSICEKYSIITKTELCESDTGQPAQ